MLCWILALLVALALGSITSSAARQLLFYAQAELALLRRKVVSSRLALPAIQHAAVEKASAVLECILPVPFIVQMTEAWISFR